MSRPLIVVLVVIGAFIATRVSHLI
ncbi:MAG: hypothetical protein RL726_1257, partial [Actinomycetota bacterium]